MPVQPLPEPGTIGLSVIGGKVGRLISVGQAVVRRPSWWTHALVVLNGTTVIQAMPRGAEYAPLAPYLEYRRAVWLTGWYALTEGQVTALRREATLLIGTPYGFSDYVSLAVPPELRPAWLRRYIEGSGRMICSQLADDLLGRVGVHLFNDGRHPSDVTPGDLHREWTYRRAVP